MLDVVRLYSSSLDEVNSCADVNLDCVGAKHGLSHLVDKDKHLNLARMNIANSGCKVVALAIQYKDWEASSVDLSNNIRIGKQGINALISALPKANKQLKAINLSDVGLGLLNRLGVAAKEKNIKIICSFPSLLTIALEFICNQLEV